MIADDSKGRTAPLVAVTVVMLGVLVLLSGRVGPVQVIQDEFSPEVFPVSAVAEAKAADLTGRTVFNEYLWGGYILYAWPEQRIFIDGMANFFGGALMEEYVTIQLGLQGWDMALRERGVDMLMLRPEVPLVSSARESPDWDVWSEDSVAVVFLRTGSDRSP
jgi:hypothetical protein